MKEANKKTLIGPVNGSFAFKICPDGTVDRNIVLCNFCNKEFSYHRSSSSLKYHLNAKHSGAKLEVMETLNGQQNASSEEENPQTTNQNILMFEPVEENQKTLFGPVNGSFGFKICPDGTVDKSTVLCNFCNKEFSYHRSSSSLKYHLNAKHSGAILEVRTLNETLDGQQNASSEDEKPQTTNQNVLTLEPVYHPDTQEQDQAIERALALWIGRTGLPLQTVEDKDFVSMMAVVDSRLKIPNKTKISNLIESIYEDERKKFKDRLATARKLTIGLGIWTTKGLGASFLSISACYFCPVQNQAQHILLSLEEISHPHAAHSIKVCLDRCTELWGIPENKILTIITSNGGKMAAAFRPEEEEPSSADSEDDERSDGEYEDEETRWSSTCSTKKCLLHIFWKR
ncbi:uncharacterized protein LOC134094702 isoform X2 [Sardina pilchardus]|uniref:uncharacterized protein LOC134094702 isoform X2 n=1 Tax=Sardina pilchardus TaxID=27697 RepID=UPI002E1419D2